MQSTIYNLQSSIYPRLAPAFQLSSAAGLLPTSPKCRRFTKKLTTTIHTGYYTYLNIPCNSTKSRAKRNIRGGRIRTNLDGAAT